MKTIGIAGGTGFVGKTLCKLLVSNDYQVVIFTRSPRAAKSNVRYAAWDPENGTIDTSALQALDAMVNLAGAGVTDKRWTAQYKREILSSRTDAGRFLIGQLQAHAPACKTYIAASATGIYGPDRPGKVPFTESSKPYNDFLADVCRAWEATSETAAALYRTVILRLGIVLGKEGGAYPALSGPMKFGIRPILGSGRQMVSWVHVADVAAMILFALEGDGVRGTYNCVAAQPVSHRALMNTIARQKGGLRIPVPVPAILLRTILGESSTEVLKSCTVSSEQIRLAGFSFQYPLIQQAVQQLEFKAF